MLSLTCHVDGGKSLTRQNHEVIDFTRSHVKNKTKLTNFVKLIRMEGYNGKEGSNPQGNKVFSRDILEIDQIGQ